MFTKDKDRKPKERNAEQALQTLQWLCSKMERCESDVHKSLYRWKVPREEWDGIVEKLVRDRFVDNERYAGAYTRQKISISGWGMTKIVNGLRAKGIDKETIEQAIEQWVKPEDMTQKLEAFLTARIKRDAPKAKSPYELRTKLFRAAASRGYDFAQINTLLNEMLKDGYDDSFDNM